MSQELSEAREATVARRADRWEHGSSFDFPRDGDTDGPRRIGDLADVVGTSMSGRGALLAILERVLTADARIWMPGYYCEDVRAAVRATFPNPLEPFADDPRDPAASLPADVRSADVVVTQNLFGLQRPARRNDAARCVVVEDHTHDPTSAAAAETDADYAFASLRKTLPLPDGAVVWSRRHPDPLPVPPSRPGELEGVAERVKAMLLKRAYLDGGDVEQGSYRRHERPMKNEMSVLPHGPMSPLSEMLLRSLPLERWRGARRRNFAVAERRLGDAGFDVLRPATADAVPFAVVVDFHDAELTARANAALLERRVFPCVLWPDAEEGYAGSFSSEHLVFRCDHRYGPDDMERVCDEIVAAAGRSRRAPVSSADG